MDHAVYSIEQVLEAFARALALDTDRDVAAHAAAQSLGITVDAVLDAIASQQTEAA